jgi:hypothetical protein
LTFSVERLATPFRYIPSYLDNTSSSLLRLEYWICITQFSQPFAKYVTWPDKTGSHWTEPIKPFSFRESVSPPAPPLVDSLYCPFI